MIEEQQAPAVEAEKENRSIKALVDNIETVIKGKRDKIQLVVATLLAKGHVLIEDNPGTGKTVLARTLAQSIASSANPDGLQFRRIQFTPDLLPMDLIGSYIFDDSKKDFVFKKGPLFCNILLSDEINRASPKVQSALLECMAENQITMGDVTHQLENVFFTIATQNPIESEGTYPLPAAQLDRFFMKLHMGYPEPEVEMSIYRDYLGIAKNLEEVKQVLSLEDILQLQKEVDSVFIHEELIRAVNNIIGETRVHPDIVLGCSTRSGINYLKCLKAYALVSGRTFVTEDDVKALAQPVLNHRIVYRTKEARTTVLDSIVANEVSRLTRLNLYA